MTVVIKDRERGILYHEALIRYSMAVVYALRAGADLEDINIANLPINVNSPKLIGQYTRGIERLYGAAPPFDPCASCLSCTGHCYYYKRRVVYSEATKFTRDDYEMLRREKAQGRLR